ncbi:MAG TPA: hypothetical protein VG456_04145 [Candidatus Sulfopaludibacter sp.]|nr:hypothetical protein [Candidatus Sulfopaludibacter sp.]
MKEHIKAEPSASSEDREAGLLAVVITLAPGVLSVAAALLNFLAARAKKK